MEVSLSGVRGRQIVRLLREHGPLSGRIIEQLLDPPIARRKCLMAIQRLREAGLVRRMQSHLPDTAGSYYCISRRATDLKILAKFLGEDHKDFDACFVKEIELRHGAQCAVWAEYFKRCYPEAKVVRDWEMRKHPELIERFSRVEEDYVYPDIFLIFGSDEYTQPVVVAVEIERTRKKIDRLRAKTQALVYQTGFDGILYVCSDYEIAEAVRAAFLSGSAKQSLRIGSYSDDFILFTNYEALTNGIGSYCVNARLQTREIHAWVSYLREVPMRERTSVGLDLHGHSDARRTVAQL